MNLAKASTLAPTPAPAPAPTQPARVLRKGSVVLRKDILPGLEEIVEEEEDGEDKDENMSYTGGADGGAAVGDVDDVDDPGGNVDIVGDSEDEQERDDDRDGECNDPENEDDDKQEDDEEEDISDGKDIVRPSPTPQGHEKSPDMKIDAERPHRRQHRPSRTEESPNVDLEILNTGYYERESIESPSGMTMEDDDDDAGDDDLVMMEDDTGDHDDNDHREDGERGNGKDR